MQTIDYDDFVALIRETISEAKRTQDKRLRTFSHNSTRSIMALYTGRKPALEYSVISLKDDINVDPTTAGDEFYEIEAGVLPLAMDPESIDTEIYEDGVGPFLLVVLEIDRNAETFNVSASDKSITGMSDLGIHVAVETPSKFSKNEMGTLRDEVANAVRHELEHVTQGKESDQPAKAFGRDEKYYNFIYSPKEVDSKHAKYLLKPSEIPAHIRGYTQNAKNIDQFKLDIENLLSGYVSQNLISKNEKQVVFDTWTDWVETNINRKGF